MAAHRRHGRIVQSPPAFSHRETAAQQSDLPRPLSKRHARRRAAIQHTSLTILFTDLRGSTALYDRVGDLAAFDLVRSHFGELIAAVAGEGGAVVKTIGDAVMATFPTADRALRAAMRMRESMRRINEERGSEDLALNIGLHEGPCLAVMLDDRQDYFGLTVNIASRVQELADPTAILATKPIVEAAETAGLVGASGYPTSSRQLSLRGVSEAFTIYEIREREETAAAA